MTKFDEWSIHESLTNKTLTIDASFYWKYTKREVSGENFDESIVTHQNSSGFSPIKALCYPVYSIF